METKLRITQSLRRLVTDYRRNLKRETPYCNQLIADRIRILIEDKREEHGITWREVYL